MSSVIKPSQKPNHRTTVSIQPSTPSLIPTLQHLERTAAALFGILTPSLGFVASHDPLSDCEHQRLLRDGVVLVAWAPVSRSDDESSDKQTDVAVGFLAAEMLDRCVFIVEMSVGRAYQGMGVGGALLRTLFAAVDGDEEGESAKSVFDAAELEMRERLRSWKRKRVSLTTYVDVPWNGPWYLRLGFLPVEANDVAGVLGPAHQQKLEEERKELERDAWVRGCFVRVPSSSIESSR